MFGCVKLRTMRVDADEHLRDLLARDAELRREFTRDFKLRNDPRITRIGRVLRITGLDELPKIFNVWLGEMSLVGPRPCTPQEYKTSYQDVPPERFHALPGLTGLWQVSGRSDIPFTDQVRLDLQYIQSAGIINDLRLLLKTIPAVISGKGAY